jgi:hypothetical protein
LERKAGLAVPNKKRKQDFGTLQSHHRLIAIKSNADLSQGLTKSLSVTQVTQGSKSDL